MESALNTHEQLYVRSSYIFSWLLKRSLLPRFSFLFYRLVMAKEEATSAFAGFHVDPLSWSNRNLEMLVFVEGGKPKNPEKNPRSKTRTSNKLNSHMARGQSRTRATLVGGERSPHGHWAIPARKNIK